MPRKLGRICSLKIWHLYQLVTLFLTYLWRKCICIEVYFCELIPDVEVMLVMFRRAVYSPKSPKTPLILSRLRPYILAEKIHPIFLPKYVRLKAMFGCPTGSWYPSYTWFVPKESTKKIFLFAILVANITEIFYSCYAFGIPTPILVLLAPNKWYYSGGGTYRTIVQVKSLKCTLLCEREDTRGVAETFCLRWF